MYIKLKWNQFAKEQVKTYSDFWYSPLLIFSLISDRRVNYVRKPSHLINVGFDQQCFQDFRTTFFQFELKVCFMRIRNLDFCFPPDSAILGWNSCTAFVAAWPGPIFHEGCQPHQTKPFIIGKKIIVAPTTLYNFDVDPIVGLLAAI